MPQVSDAVLVAHLPPRHHPFAAQAGILVICDEPLTPNQCQNVPRGPNYDAMMLAWVKRVLPHRA
eukprot:5263933-Amphidinium_carterae.1